MKYQLRNGRFIFIDDYLQMQLDNLVYNIKRDWDFVIVISGDRRVRTGKSVLAMNIAAYLGARLNTNFDLKNIFFDSQEMIKEAREMPKFSVIQYDEGREGLAANKSATNLQKDILDYFAECGQLNHIFIVVLPDFFELKEQIAVPRSEFLINAYIRNEVTNVNLYGDGYNPAIYFRRGNFQFFSRSKKAMLYDISRSTHRKSYRMVTPNFIGKFRNFYPVDEMAYKEKKLEALTRFSTNEKAAKVLKTDIFRDKIIIDLHKNEELSYKEIAEKLANDWGYSYHVNSIQKVVSEYKKSLASSIIS
jgi:hypothetical protein